MNTTEKDALDRCQHDIVHRLCSACSPETGMLIPEGRPAPAVSTDCRFIRVSDNRAGWFRVRMGAEVRYTRGRDKPWFTTDGQLDPGDMEPFRDLLFEHMEPVIVEGRRRQFQDIERQLLNDALEDLGLLGG